MTSVSKAWVAGVAAVTAGWVVVALSGGDWAPGHGSSGPAVAAGASALVGAGWWPRAARSLAPAGAALVALPVAVAAAAGGSAWPAAAVVAALVAGEVAAGLRVGRARGPWLALLVVGAVVLLAAAAAGLDTDPLIRELHAGPVASSLSGAGREVSGAPLLGAAAGAFLLLGAGLAPPRARAPALPGLIVGMASVAQLPAPPVAVVLCAAAAAVAGALGPERTGLCLGLLGLAAGSVPGGVVAGVMLASGATLALAVHHPAAVLFGLPGAASLAQLVVAEGLGVTGAVVALATAGVAFVLASRLHVAEPAWPRPGVIPALVLGLWLVLLPGTWGWAGGYVLRRYDGGAVLAAAAGIGAVMVSRADRPGWRRAPRNRDAVGARVEGGEGAAEVDAGAMVTSSSAAHGHRP